MEKTYEKVDATTKSNVRFLRKYANRFGFMNDDTDNIETFVNKIDNRLDYFFEKSYSYQKVMEEVTYPVYQILGRQYSVDNDNCHYRMSYLHFLLLECRKNHELVPVLMVCDLLLQLIHKNSAFIEFKGRDSFINGVAEDLLTSNINAVLYKTLVGYDFFPATEPLFDEAVVMDVLNWLNDYPRSKKQYDKTLNMILYQAAPRDSIDNLRLSLELFMKEYFKNEKSLENQKNSLGECLTSHNVTKHFSSMYTTLFTHYTAYNNNEAKHNNTADEQEIDFLLYLTGSFIRFLIKLKRDERKV